MRDVIRVERNELPPVIPGQLWHVYREIGIKILQKQADVDTGRIMQWRHASKGTGCDLVLPGPGGQGKLGIKITVSSVGSLSVRSKNLLIPAYRLDRPPSPIYDVVVGVFVVPDAALNPLQGCRGFAAGFVRLPLDSKTSKIAKKRAGEGIPNSGKGNTVVIPVRDTLDMKVLLNDMHEIGGVKI